MNEQLLFNLIFNKSTYPLAEVRLIKDDKTDRAR